MRLIDADNIVFDYSGLVNIPPLDFKGIAEYFAKQINAMPEQLIRCKNCKYHRKDKDSIPYCCRLGYGYGWQDDDFCSCAKENK